VDVAIDVQSKSEKNKKTEEMTLIAFQEEPTSTKM
jgi:hypothetical protein